MLKFILQTTVGKKILASVFKHVQLKNAGNHDELLRHIFLLAYDRRKETCFASEGTKK